MERFLHSSGSSQGSCIQASGLGHACLVEVCGAHGAVSVNRFHSKDTGQKQSPVKGAPLCSHHQWCLRTTSGLLKGTWEGQGLSRTGQGGHFLWGAATVNYVNRICNPESDIKQLSPIGSFLLKLVHFLFCFSPPLLGQRHLPTLRVGQ